MATTIRTIVLDEIMLPGPGGDVGLEPSEASFIAGSGADGDIEIPAVALVCRVPGRPAPTALEQRAKGSPGELSTAALLGSGVLWPATEDDPAPRLALEETTRVKLETIEATEGGWQATITPWPYERTALEGVGELVQRFYRALLVTRDPDPIGLREQLERPIQELEAAEDDLTRLLLLADYLFDSPHARSAVLVAAQASEVYDLVGDALQLIEEGLPTGAHVVRPAIKAYLHAVSQEGLGQLGSTAAVVAAVAPSLQPSERDARALTDLLNDIADVQGRFDALITRLVATRRR